MKKKCWFRWVVQWKINILATLLLLVAFILTMSRILVIVLAQYPAFIEKWMSTALMQPVTIEAVHADWTSLDPGIRFKNVLIKDVNQQSFIKIKQLTLDVDLLGSVLRWQLLPGRLTIDGVNLDVDNKAHHLQVRGILSYLDHLQLSNYASALSDVLNWILAKGHVEIKHVNIRYHTQQGFTYFLHNVHIHVRNHFFTHRIFGGATISNKSPTHIRFTAKLKDIDFTDARFNARFYIQLRNLQISNWVHLSGLRPYVKDVLVHDDGCADLDLWVDWHKTHVTHWEGQGHLKHLSTQWLASHQLLDVNDMFAYFIWNSADNLVHFNIERMVFTLPNEYDAPLAVKNFKMQFRWSEDHLGTHLYVPNYQFDFLGLQTQGRFYLTLPISGEPIIDFLSNYRFSQLANLWRLFPNHHLSSWNRWLHQAFLKGHIDNAILAYHGPFSDQAFKNHRGHLSAVFPIQDLNFSYYFNWPTLRSMQTNIEVNNNQISAYFFKANLNHQPISELTAHLDNFMKPHLIIESALHSDIAHMYQLIQSSPIAFRKELNKPLQKGPLALHYLLDIDFSKPVFPIRSEGEASIMGNPLNFKLHTEPLVTQLDLNGKANLDSAHSLLPFDVFNKISGHAKYQATIRMFKPQQHLKQFDAHLTAQLQDLVFSGVPKFINKAMCSLNSVKIHIWHYRNKPIATVLQHNNTSIRLLANYQKNHIKLLSGEVYIGRKLPPQRHISSGFVVYGKIAHFNWGLWQPLIMPFIHEENGAIDIPKVLGLPLHDIELEFSQLEAYHQLISNMYFKLMPRIHDWMFQIKSAKVMGTLLIPNYSGGTWVGHLRHLLISNIKTNQSKPRQKPLKIDPRVFPPIDIEIKKLRYGDTDYGHLKLHVLPVSQGVAISTFSVDSTHFNLNMHGLWKQYSHHQSLAVSGYFKTQNLGQALLGWNIKEAVLGGRGMSKFQLSWEGSDDHMMFDTVTGKLGFNFQHGRILKMDSNEAKKLSLGRIINMLSIDSLPRRFSFDFSDLTAKGLAFHSLEGQMNIKKGVCKLRKTMLESATAKLKIKGIINFPKKYYNLDVSVFPYVTSSVPVIVGIVGGPVAGIIAWLMNKIMTPQIGKMLGFVYHAKGSWNRSKTQALPVPARTYSH